MTMASTNFLKDLNPPSAVGVEGVGGGGMVTSYKCQYRDVPLE